MGALKYLLVSTGLVWLVTFVLFVAYAYLRRHISEYDEHKLVRWLARGVDQSLPAVKRRIDNTLKDWQFIARLVAWFLSLLSLSGVVFAVAIEGFLRSAVAPLTSVAIVLSLMSIGTILAVFLLKKLLMMVKLRAE